MTATIKPGTRHPCPGCGRLVAYRLKTQRIHGGGKGRVKHLCPHGEWCVFGEKCGRMGWNWPRCKECLKVAREKYRARQKETA